jgi:tetratricopeptide (TPR) repeat protein
MGPIPPPQPTPPTHSLATPVPGLPLTQQAFADLPALLEASRVVPPMRHAGTFVTAAWIGVVIAWLVGVSAAGQTALIAVAWLATIGGASLNWWANRARRDEQTELLAIEDLLALKRVEQVAPRLHWIMLRPMRAPEGRLRALLLLATTLTRMQRYDDAILVYNELIETERVAGPGGAMVKLGRAMAMLHADHLYDADRAINDLRRLIDRGGAGVEMLQMDDSVPAPAADPMSIAALRLVELFRDVKTGHFAEAIDLFHAHRDTIRRGLGHRVAEAHALAAVAYDRASRPADAARAFADATALQPMAELLNRYVEVRPLIAKYAPTPVPAV